MPTTRSYSYRQDSCPTGTRPVHNCMNLWLAKPISGFSTSWKRYIFIKRHICQANSYINSALVQDYIIWVQFPVLFISNCCKIYDILLGRYYILKITISKSITIRIIAQKHIKQYDTKTFHIKIETTYILL